MKSLQGFINTYARQEYMIEKPEISQILHGQPPCVHRRCKYKRRARFSVRALVEIAQVSLSRIQREDLRASS